MRRRFTLATLVFAVVGCRSSLDDRLVGVWTAVPSESTNPAKLIPGVQTLDPSFVQMITLKLRSDHTYALTAPIAVTGRWSLSGRTISLTLDKTNQKLSGPLSLLPPFKSGTLNADASRITIRQATPFGEVSFALKKTA
jgi:hypothetical protein